MKFAPLALLIAAAVELLGIFLHHLFFK